MQSSFALTADRQLHRQRIGLLVLGGLSASTIYLLASWHAIGFGFPLDDSWIHLAYARNLAEFGQWAFMPGQPSAASTAPLWTALLAPGFLLHLGPHIWTYLLGIACLIGIGIVVESIIREQVPIYRPRIPWAGLLMVTEWHFVWAAVSGMETLLYILVVLLVVRLLLRGGNDYLKLGVLIGLTVWVRPDGVTLLIPATLVAMLTPDKVRQKAKSLVLLAGGFAASVLPYILMNLALAGRPFPNTFYAKQAEYISWRLSPTSLKLENFSLVFLGGVAFIFLPAVLGATIRALNRHNWSLLICLGWAAGYAWLYTSRLPVYQHGRYIMPSMAIYMVIGLIFVVEWSGSVMTRMERLLRFAWVSAIVLISGIFFIYGATVYAKDVVNIEKGMVYLARWSEQNLPDGSLVGAHDIGALGFFAPELKIIDLAGLASPEVVSFINDEPRLADYLHARQTDYLIIPIWHYPYLANLGHPIFTTQIGLAIISLEPTQP